MQLLNRLSQMLLAKAPNHASSATAVPTERGANVSVDVFAESPRSAPAIHASAPSMPLAAPAERRASDAQRTMEPVPQDAETLAAAETPPSSEQVAEFLTLWVRTHGGAHNAREVHALADSLCAVTMYDDMTRFIDSAIDVDMLQDRTRGMLAAVDHVMNAEHGLGWSVPAMPSFETAFLIDDERLFAEARQMSRPSAWKAIAARTVGMAMGAPFGFYAMVLGGHVAEHLHRKVTHEPQGFQRTAVRLAGLSVGAAFGGPAAMLAAQGLAAELDTKLAQCKDPLTALGVRAMALFKAMQSMLSRSEDPAPLFTHEADADDDAHGLSDWEIVEAIETQKV